MSDPGTVRCLRLCLLAAIAALLASVILFYIAPWPAFVREAIVIVGIAAYAVFAMLVVFSRCPRCNHRFHNVLGFNNPLARHCSHCGLSLDTDDDG